MGHWRNIDYHEDCDVTKQRTSFLRELTTCFSRSKTILRNASSLLENGGTQKKTWAPCHFQGPDASGLDKCGEVGATFQESRKRKGHNGRERERSERRETDLWRKKWARKMLAFSNFSLIPPSLRGPLPKTGLWSSVLYLADLPRRRMEKAIVSSTQWSTNTFWPLGSLR